MLALVSSLTLAAPLRHEEHLKEHVVVAKAAPVNEPHLAGLSGSVVRARRRDPTRLSQYPPKFLSHLELARLLCARLRSNCCEVRLSATI